MKAYKFVDPKHADVVAKGSVKLATAEEYRKLEAELTARADASEMSTSAPILGGEEVIPGSHHLNRNFVCVERGERVFHDVNIVGASVQMIVDAYLYCCSLADEELPGTEGQSVFEIADIAEFGNRLWKHPQLSCREFEHGPVVYRSLVEPQSALEIEDVDPFRKDASFAWEREYRLLWPAQMFERAIYLNVPEVCDLLRRVR